MDIKTIELLKAVVSIMNALDKSNASILNKLNEQYKLNAVLANKLQRQSEINEMRYRDLLEAMNLKPRYKPDELIDVSCTEQVAVQSVDHIYPRGTASDNTRWPAFVKKCEDHFQGALAYLDLGCSGGGLVLDFVLRGHFAMGLEGSDYSLKRLRAEWRTIPGNLFTCNIGKRFLITSKKDKTVMQFQIISAWDVLEHLSRTELDALFLNVREHLKDNGYFIGSVATKAAVDMGNDINHHVTVEDRDWWIKLFMDNGFVDVSGEVSFCTEDFPRGTYNINDSRDFTKLPEAGFHFILGKSKNKDTVVEGS